jgi:hypothetical protein
MIYKGRILVACEESQAVTKEFRALGFEAFSCDIQECSGGHPEWHLQQDVIPLLKEKWDMIIAFPPCTYLSGISANMFSMKRRGNTEEKIQERIKNREKGFEFFMQFVNADCSRIAIENPVGYVSNHYRKPDQYIQPYYFGDNERKKTCLWLKGLPLLQATNMLPKPKADWFFTTTDGAIHGIHFVDKVYGSKERSKTFPGIAKVMAEQWGAVIV